MWVFVDHPWDTRWLFLGLWWPSCRLLPTILRMLDDWPGDSGRPPLGLWVTNLGMVVDYTVDAVRPYRVSQKELYRVFLNISATKYLIFKSFFYPKNWDSYANFEYKTISVRYQGGQDIYKTNWVSKTDKFIFILSHSGLKTMNFVQSSANWPKIDPDSPQVVISGPSHPNRLNRCYNCFYLDCLQNMWEL